MSSGQSYKLLKIKRFLKEYKFENWYLSTIIPQEMRKDMPVSIQLGSYRWNSIIAYILYLAAKAQLNRQCLIPSYPPSAG
jgi:hypothetical protein